MNRGVSRVDDSEGFHELTAIGGRSQNGAAAFTTTHWSVVLAARGPSPAAEEALEELCRTYWRPIYAFLRRQGTEAEEAKDLTQGFFALLLERRDLDTVRKEKGRLRSYLLTSLKHYLTNKRNRAMAIKRNKGQRLISLDQLNQVLARLEEEHRAAGKMQLFDRLQKSFTDDPDRSSQVKIAHELGMTENAVNQAFHRFRQRYRELLREEVAHTVAVAVDIEDELRHLIAVLRA